MLWPRCKPLPHPIRALPAFMLILLVPYHLLKATLTCSQAWIYTLTGIDSNDRAESCASALLSGWVSCFGVPTTITSDRGQLFESHLWNSLMNLLGSTCNRTTAYHPQANGIVERFHRRMKAWLKARLVSNNWVEELQVVLLGIRITFKENLSSTSAELVHAQHWLRLSEDFFGSKPTVDWTLPRFYQDYVIRCTVNSSPLHGGMDHMIPTFLLTSTPQVMSMSHVTITSHLLHEPTSDPIGFSEDQASISPLTLKKSLFIKKCQ